MFFFVIIHLTAHWKNPCSMESCWLSLVFSNHFQSASVVSGITQFGSDLVLIQDHSKVGPTRTILTDWTIYPGSKPKIKNSNNDLQDPDVHAWKTYSYPIISHIQQSTIRPETQGHRQHQPCGEIIERSGSQSPLCRKKAMSRWDFN